MVETGRRPEILSGLEMLFLNNIGNYLMQVVYWMTLAIFCIWLYVDTVESQHTSALGKLIGLVGGVFGLVGFDSCSNAFYDFVRYAMGNRPGMYEPGLYERMYRVHGFTHLPAEIAGAMMAVGVGLLYWGVYSERFARPESKEGRIADRGEAKAGESVH
ncbi:MULTISPECIES: hypothetical protein [unclassified Burkholderia]|uniref:hypothetical protein n=1 Tax=unclassified Burkholderia TaxID=2613784 RepID=UPI000F5EF532|nr:MULTISPECIES: hypothetical protein [unclassified Burkholderia]